MSKSSKSPSRAFRAGIKINWLNIALIVLGLIMAVGMINATYHTADAFESVFSTTDHFLDSQQTTGMLDSLSEAMLLDCRAYLSDDDPAHVFSFDGQLKSLNAQLSASESTRAEGETTDADKSLENALAAFREMTQTELYAMRLHAESLRVPLTAYPDLLQEVTLSEEDAALPAEQKQETAAALLSSENFTGAKSRMDAEISTNHRLNSETSRAKLGQAQGVVNGVVARQKLFVFLFALFAVIALVLNFVLVIRPIQRSVKNLDNREQVPVRGAYEFRRLASTYNTLLEENNRRQEALAYTASHDPLTDVLNRSVFEENYHASGEQYDALMIVDVDHFKQYNDSHGHDTGDRVLQAVTRTIREQIREEDLLCRIGGDEFVVLMKNTGPEDAGLMQEKIRLINRKLSSGEDDVPKLTVSVGVAFAKDLKGGEDLFKCADNALLKVKEEGRCGSAIYGRN